MTAFTYLGVSFVAKTKEQGYCLLLQRQVSYHIDQETLKS